MNPDYDGRLREVLRLHFDEKHGSAYWLEKQRRLGFFVAREVLSVDDLWRLGPMDLDDLASRPAADFVPRRFLESRRPIVTAETGGATGAPKATVYFEEEFLSVFVDPFLEIAGALGFSGGPWLWVGPGGPHIIGKAASAIARKASGFDAFSVDFDPRWYRSLAPESIARRRYLDHVAGQAMRVLRRERIENLFSTPVVLAELARRAEPALRERIGGIYLGGMALRQDTMRELEAAFPSARFVAGYGNTLFGVCHAAGDLRGRFDAIRYFPHGARLVMRLVPLDAGMPDGERIRRVVPPGGEGRVMFHRFDESCFLANVLERDRGLRAAPDEAESRFGPSGEGVENPCPLETALFTADAGIY